MKYTESEVLSYVSENDVKFIKLTFCDLFGRTKNISITSDKLPETFAKGLAFDAAEIDGFSDADDSDMILMPDPSTLCLLPWRPDRGRVVRMFCDIFHADGRAYVNDSRRILKKAIDDTKDLGYRFIFGPECEFYLFKTDADGNPLHTPHDRAGYLDTSPKDKGENLRRDICFTLEEMSLTPQCSHHEAGPGQHEIGFKPTSALDAADNILTYFMTAKAIAARNGLYASFMPHPIPDETGNGFHINISLYDKLKNVFYSDDGSLSPQAEAFSAGILDRVCDMTAFFNQTANSYERLALEGMPKYVSWSFNNRSNLIRIPKARPENARVELRSPDALCNPYIAFALLIYAGADGIKRGLTLPECSKATDAHTSRTGFTRLPENLREALAAASESDFLREHLPSETLDSFLRMKRLECDAYDASSDKPEFEYKRYF